MVAHLHHLQALCPSITTGAVPPYSAGMYDHPQQQQTQLPTHHQWGSCPTGSSFGRQQVAKLLALQGLLLDGDVTWDAVQAAFAEAAADPDSAALATLQSLWHPAAV